jgi:uncharacterized protein (DUF305 family)
MKQAIRRALVAACLIPTACAARNEVRPAAGGAAPSREEVPQAEPHAHEPPHELPATAGEGYTAADVRFMQNMIGHHAQALTMVAMAPDHGAGMQLLRLAQKIDISQRDEIDFMKRWLAERTQAIPDDAHAHDMRMPGMLTPQQLAQLDAARGGEFERLFLSFMIQHHLGALEMVEGLFASPGAAQDSEIFRFITDVDADQRDEIFVMQSMLDMLDTASGSRSR